MRSQQTRDMKPLPRASRRECPPWARDQLTWTHRFRREFSKVHFVGVHFEQLLSSPERAWKLAGVIFGKMNIRQNNAAFDCHCIWNPVIVNTFSGFGASCQNIPRIWSNSLRCSGLNIDKDFSPPSLLFRDSYALLHGRGSGMFWDTLWRHIPL